MNDESKKLQPINLQLIRADYEKDEVSLYELYSTLIKYRIYIVAIICICIILSILYAYAVTPIYRADVYLLPPNKRDISGLNIGVYSYSPKVVFQSFIDAFKSRSFRMQYFEENNLMKLYGLENYTDIKKKKVFENIFNKNLYIDDEVNTGHFESSNEQQASEILNKYIDFIVNKVVGSLKQDLQNRISLNKKELQNEIAFKRETEVQRLKNDIKGLIYKDNNTRKEILDKIDLLKKQYIEDLKNEERDLNEALKVAENLNIEDPYSIPFIETMQSNKAVEQSIDIPLYTYGTKDLKLKLKALKIKKESDFLIPGVAELEKELNSLEHNTQIDILNEKIEKIETGENLSIYISGLEDIEEKILKQNELSENLKMNNTINPVVVDQYSILPLKRIKPIRSVIVIIGAISGVVISILLIVVSNIRNNAEKQVV